MPSQNKATQVLLVLRTMDFVPKNWTIKVRFCMLNLQKMGFETHLCRGYKTSNADCQDQTQVGSCPSSDFKPYGIRNAEMKKEIYKGSVLYSSKDGISCGSKTFPNTAALQCVTSETVLMPHSVELRGKKKMQSLFTYFSFLVLGHHSKHQSKNKVCAQTGLAIDDLQDTTEQPRN